MNHHSTTSSQIVAARSFLFVPAHRPERYQKALSSGADAVIIDLEDALPLAAKAEGRESLLAMWPSLPEEVRSKLLVRINPLGTPWYDEDVLLLSQLGGLGALMLPKTESVAQILDISSKVAGIAILPLIETAKGVANVNSIAAANSVSRLGLGHIDLQADLGMATGIDEAELAPIRIAMVIASRLANIAPPVDGVTTTTTEEDIWLAATQRSRRFGFGGKLCIHPSQIRGVHTGFAPSAAEVDWAKRVIVAEEQAGGGAFSVDGKMVDAPVILLARQLLQRAQRPL